MNRRTAIATILAALVPGAAVAAPAPTFAPLDPTVPGDAGFLGKRGKRRRRRCRRRNKH